jgi:hypothetical protein
VLRFEDRDLRAVGPALESLQGLGIELPGQLAEYRDAAEALVAAVPARPPENPLTVEESLVRATIAAAAAGEALPEADVLLDARRAAEAAKEASRIRKAAIEVAGHHLNGGLRGAAKTLVTGPLSSLLHDCLSEAKEAATAVGSVRNAEEALGASERVRKAWLSVQRLAGRYSAIRTAQERLRPLCPAVQHDTWNLYAEMRNFDEVWPRYRSRRDAPWPSDPVGRLQWLATHVEEAGVWVPTPQQQDERFLEVNGEAMRRQEVSRVAAFANVGYSP